MRYSKEILEKIVNSSNNYSEVTRKLGLKPFYGNRQTVKKYIELFEINTKHFRGGNNKGKSIKLELSEILIENSSYTWTTNLKARLYNEGLKQKCCELCGQNEMWYGKKMSLILDHINGKNNDNRIENLRIVCPNCNATLPTHGGKNISWDITKPEKPKKVNKLRPRKVERPPYDQLILEISDMGYTKTGKKYGVSDNSIRKWVKYYEKNLE
jgi:hypothetical protein